MFAARITNSPCLLASRCVVFQQASAPLLAQPVAVAADGDDVAVMEEAAERGRSLHERVAAIVNIKILD